MLLIEYVGHIGLRSLTGGHLGRHLEYLKALNDARVASVGLIMYNASTNRNRQRKTLLNQVQDHSVLLQDYFTVVILLYYITKKKD